MNGNSILNTIGQEGLVGSVQTQRPRSGLPPLLRRNDLMRRIDDGGPLEQVSSNNNGLDLGQLKNGTGPASQAKTKVCLECFS